MTARSEATGRLSSRRAYSRSPSFASYPGSFEGTVGRSHEYRIPAPFAGCRVLVVGAGQSAAEVAVEVSKVAERTFMSLRGGVHVIPRWIGRDPYDAADVAPLNRLPWRLLNLTYSGRVTRTLGPLPPSWPAPAHRLLEGIPIVSSELIPAMSARRRRRAKPVIERLIGDRVRFVDESEELIDRGSRLRHRISRSASPSCPLRSCRPTVAICCCTGASLLPRCPGCSSPGSSMRLEGCCRWWRRRGNGWPPCSAGSFDCPRRSGCAGRSSAPSGEPAGVSRKRVPAASVAIRMPTGDCCARICASPVGGCDAR